MKKLLLVSSAFAFLLAGVSSVDAKPQIVGSGGTNDARVHRGKAAQSTLVADAVATYASREGSFAEYAVRAGVQNKSKKKYKSTNNEKNHSEIVKNAMNYVTRLD